MTHCHADGEGSQKVKIFTAGQTGKIGRTIFSQLQSRAPAPIPRSFLSFPQIVKFSPLLSSKCLRANTSVLTEKGKRSPCGATVPTPPPLLCPTLPYCALLCNTVPYCALLCPPHHPFSCPHVLRGQKTGRWVALVESPSGAGREANSLPYLRP